MTEFRIRYLTEYGYATPVSDSVNALRVRPTTTPTQRLERFSVTTRPSSVLRHHVDYFGTTVEEFDVVEPHDELVIDVRAEVASSDPEPPPQAGWDDLAAAGYAEGNEEFLADWEAVPVHSLLDELADGVRGATPLESVLALVELIPERLEYRPGATGVETTVEQVLDARAGVCQDFVHLSLILLRRLGIAARYTSGYLFAAPSDGGADSVEVETHAWLEALLPAPGGPPVWVGADPTNRRLAGAEHVKIGHGRRYSDVPPIKGVHRGTTAATLNASVKMTRVNGG